MAGAGLNAGLVTVLTRARDLGFLGPGPVAGHLDHASGFLRAVGGPPELMVDLGSGGGLPGLVLADAWPSARVALVDSNERRALFLAGAAAELGLDLVVVIHARAEEMGHDPAWRGQAEVVVARSFGAPAVTAECAAPLLQVGGRLVVSEPPPDPGAAERWPAEGLAVLGLRPAGRTEQAFSRFQVLVQEQECPAPYARRTGIPAKRPLF